MTSFTPVSALAGGVLIGMSATLLLWLNGRIAGMSGILNGAVLPGESDRAWRWFFLAGVVTGAAMFALANPDSYELREDFLLAWVATAGFLVGLGTRVSGGCTSRHGVCGIARLSVRSKTATLLFVAAGMLTTYVARHLLGLPS